MGEEEEEEEKEEEEEEEEEGGVRYFTFPQNTLWHCSKIHGLGDLGGKLPRLV